MFFYSWPVVSIDDIRCWNRQPRVAFGVHESLRGWWGDYMVSAEILLITNHVKTRLALLLFTPNITFMALRSYTRKIIRISLSLLLQLILQATIFWIFDLKSPAYRRFINLWLMSLSFNILLAIFLGPGSPASSRRLSRGWGARGQEWRQVGARHVCDGHSGSFLVREWLFLWFEFECLFYYHGSRWRGRWR